MHKTVITALITCHNRKSKTIKCLESLLENLPVEGVSVDAVLVDDGSTDGTKEAVTDLFPFVKVLKGDGTLFWNKGMHLALEEGLKKDADFYLLLNDDTVLFNNAIQSLITTWKEVTERSGIDSIIVGSTCDPVNGKTTYGGVYRPTQWKKTSFALVEPGTQPKLCETMNCNCVLLPKSIAMTIGNFNLQYAHSMGDFDYAFRARKAGFHVWVAPGHIGTCSKNDPKGSYTDTSLPVRTRWKKMMQPKGLPPYSWYVYTKQHTSVLWPIFWLWPYARLAMNSVYASIDRCFKK